MQDLIPRDITKAEKQGFSGPDASWFKGDSIDFVKRRLMDPNASIYNMIDITSTQNLINEHLEGKQNRRLMIWSLLSIEEWFQQFMTV